MYHKLRTGMAGTKHEFTRIETGHTRVGVPDLYWSTPNNNGWLEFKVVYSLQVPVIKPDWRPGQLGWIREHVRLYDNIWLAVTDKEEDVMLFILSPVQETYVIAECSMFMEIPIKGALVHSMLDTIRIVPQQLAPI